MKKRFSPVVVGLFVVGFFILGAAAVLSFGGKRWLGSHARFVVVATNVSVGGLDPGSAVKLSGVRVGRVESVNVSLDAEGADFDIRIVCDLDDENALKVFGTEVGRTERLIEDLVERGLQAKLKLAGITGLLYLDLEIQEIDQKPEVSIDAETGAPIVPMASSRLDEYLGLFEKIITNVAAIDFAGISDRSKTLLESLNTVVTEADLPSAVRSVDEAAQALTALMEGEDVKGAVAAFGRAAGAMEGLLAALDEAAPEMKQSLEEVLVEAAQTFAVLSEAGARVDELFGSRGGLPAEIGRTLDSIQAVADTLSELVDYLERNPDALVRGRAAQRANASN